MDIQNIFINQLNVEMQMYIILAPLGAVQMVRQVMIYFPFKMPLLEPLFLIHVQALVLPIEGMLSFQIKQQ